MPDAFTDSSTRACRRPFRFGASWAALMAEFRTMWPTFALRAAVTAFDPIEGSSAEAGVSSHMMSTPSKASVRVSGSSRSPATTSTPFFWRAWALAPAGSRTNARSLRPGLPLSAPSRAVVALLAAVGVHEAVGLVEVEHVGVDAGTEPGLERLVGGTDLPDVACV